MDSYTLESFINFCDDMMIAEEKLGNISTIADTIEKRNYILKSKMESVKTTEDKIKIIKEMKSYLINYKSDIEKVKPNLFDTRFMKRLADSIGVAISTVLVPVTFGLSILGIVGFSAAFKMADTPDIAKKKLLDSIDDQIKNCDKILKYLEKETVATDGVKDFINNRKHIHSIRRENRQVNKEYKKVIKDNKKNPHGEYVKLRDASNTEDIKKNYPKSSRVLLSICKDLINAFNKGVNVETDGSHKIKFEYNIELCDNDIHLYIYGDEKIFDEIYREDMETYENIIYKLDDITKEVISKYQKYNPNVDSNPDDSCALDISIDNQD